MNGLKGLAFAGLIVSASALAGPKIELVSAEDFGDAWPFSVEEMHLLCMSGNAVVASDPETGRMYPLNGTAKAMASRLALEPLENVWRKDPSVAGLRVSVSPMIEKGLALCAG
jgi:hypothetical protein